jgi:3-hydroxybutyryl-CoA dehydrogenase
MRCNITQLANTPVVPCGSLSTGTSTATQRQIRRMHQQRPGIVSRLGLPVFRSAIGVSFHADKHNRRGRRRHDGQRHRSSCCDQRPQRDPDVDDAAVAKGTHVVETSRARLVAKGKMPAAEKTAALGRIQGSITYSDLKPVGVIIEAGNEDYDLKAKILKQIDKSVSGDAIFASNTSPISVTMLASLISHPDRFVGVHFFNPVPVIALVEIVRGLQTSDAMHEAVTTLATRLGKSSISVKSAPGFVVNLVLLPMINEAFFVLAEDEASANEIDPGDEARVQPSDRSSGAGRYDPTRCPSSGDADTSRRVRRFKYRPCPLLTEMVAAGYLGRKSGRGIFNYQQ